MTADPIVDEVRKLREGYAAEVDFDLDATFDDLKKRESKSGLDYEEREAKPHHPEQQAA